MNALARFILRLFAIYWVVAGLASCARVPGDLFRFTPLDEMPQAVEFAWIAAPSLAVFLLLGVVPAVLLMLFATPIADRLFSSSEVEPHFEVTVPGLYVLGCSLLALWFIISGAAGAVSGASLLLFDLALDSQFHIWRSPAATLLASLVELGLGYLLWRHASNRAHAA